MRTALIVLALSVAAGVAPVPSIAAGSLPSCSARDPMVFVSKSGHVYKRGSQQYQDNLSRVSAGSSPRDGTFACKSKSKAAMQPGLSHGGQGVMPNGMGQSTPRP